MALNVNTTDNLFSEENAVHFRFSYLIYMYTK